MNKKLKFYIFINYLLFIFLLFSLLFFVSKIVNSLLHVKSHWIKKFSSFCTINWHKNMKSLTENGSRFIADYNLPKLPNVRR